MRRLRKSQAFLKHSPNPWKKLPRAWNRYPLWYSITPLLRKSPPPAAQSFSIRYKTWKSFWQSSSYKALPKIKLHTSLIKLCYRAKYKSNSGNYRFHYAIPPSPGLFGSGDFFAYIEYPSQSVRYLLVYTLTKAFQTCTPLPATVLPGFSLSPDRIPSPH